MSVIPSWKTMARIGLIRGNSRISSTASKRMPSGLKVQLEAWVSSLDKGVQVGISQLEGMQLVARQQGVLGMGGPEDQI